MDKETGGDWTGEGGQRNERRAGVEGGEEEGWEEEGKGTGISPPRLFQKVGTYEV